MVSENIFWELCKLIAKYDIAIISHNINDATEYAKKVVQITQKDIVLTRIFNIPQRFISQGIHT